MAADKHIVDVLIEERAPRLARSLLWPIFNPLLRLLLGYRRARAMADALAPLSGRAAFGHVSRLLHLHTLVRGVSHVPSKGRCILIANHPTGIADGIALDDAVRPKRPDLCYFANADAHRVCPGLIDLVIPVAWPKEKRTLKSTRRTLSMAKDALNAERPIAIFAAGAMSRHTDGRLRDPQWEHSPITLARRFDARVVPVHISGPSSALFHFFDRFSEELRDVTLFHELLNKAGHNYTVTIGPAILPGNLNIGDAEVTRHLKDYVECTLPVAPDVPFADCITTRTPPSRLSAIRRANA